MLRIYNAGNILQVALFGRVDGQMKPRPALFWMERSNDPSQILVSGIFGTEEQRKWEYRLFPSPDNGLTKICFVRVDNTQYIPTDSVLKIRGLLSSVEFEPIKRMMIDYSNEYKANSPKDFGCDTFDIFNL
jgi:hypothetical protein